ncbi:hypothetical protein L2K70_02370 [Nocardioides KLBMP 9356]|uniref:Ig-like domain-containing protein n=1 Tax=Nocardioides potassii TaxID=2911371 RepID=A0ABS9H847_9ACTN|nr:hypothetical protein [Nocardioides potassii]MCF6376437.1 hypothetical protein [Nocardioides potassii]
MRKVLASGLAAALGVSTVLGAVPASAGPTSGSTELLGPAVGGGEVTVRATIGGVYPVVSYDFALLNQCWFKGKFSGRFDSSETYPLLGPWYDAGNGAAYSDEVINLNSVPSGAVCKVSIVRGGPVVKGTTTSYAVG